MNDFVESSFSEEISQSPWFERTWASLYEAFEDGRIDEDHLRKARCATTDGQKRMSTASDEDKLQPNDPTTHHHPDGAGKAPIPKSGPWKSPGG